MLKKIGSYNGASTSSNYRRVERRASNDEEKNRGPRSKDREELSRKRRRLVTRINRRGSSIFDGCLLETKDRLKTAFENSLALAYTQGNAVTHTKIRSSLFVAPTCISRRERPRIYARDEHGSSSARLDLRYRRGRSDGSS